MDRSVAKVPTMSDHLVSANETCVVVGTLAAPDGETTIALTDETPTDLNNLTQVFDGSLLTPALKLSVYTTRQVELLETKVSTSETHIQIWVNREQEPDDIRILILDHLGRKRKN